MTSDTDTDSDRDGGQMVWAKFRLRVERASVPTLGEFEGLRLVVETTSGGRLAKLLVLVALALVAAYFGPVPTPW